MRGYRRPPYYLTAYGLAVQQGFEGTLEEWLDSLVGPMPEIGIGEVETLPGGSEARVTVTGTKENPLLNFGIPQGVGMEDALPLIGGTMRGNINMASFRVYGLLPPAADDEPVTRGYFATPENLPIVPVSKGGLGSTTVAQARSVLGLGETEGAVPVESGGTGVTSLEELWEALGLGEVFGVVPVESGGTGATTAAEAARNLGLVREFASACGSSDSLTLPKDTMMQITLDTWKQRSTEDFSFTDGGIRMPKAGVVQIDASVYFSFAEKTAPAVVGVHAFLNGAEICGVAMYNETYTGVQMAPVMAQVAEGDVLTLRARSIYENGSCIPSAKATALSVVYL